MTATTMKKKKITYLIANFGGPRNLDEVFPFLKSLLNDPEVIRPKLPRLLHRFLFTRLAKKRAKTVIRDYETIGGKSPIYADTEAVAACLRQQMEGTILTFHRYIPATHKLFIQSMKNVQSDEIRVFPMFPQFTYATTGSIARWFQHHLPQRIVNRVRWVKSYPGHPAFVQTTRQHISRFFRKHQLDEDKTILLFSAHGIPKAFVAEGDVYEDECQASFHAVMEGFPTAMGQLAYQSKFGRDEWLKPYTIDVCRDIDSWRKGRSHIVFVPISFTSDHIETLFEIEQEYMTVIKRKGLKAYRVPALTCSPDWIHAIVDILNTSPFCNNHMLVRHTNISEGV
ncbi:MAG: ferrochelatase [Waddliaceae bacterium]